MKKFKKICILALTITHVNAGKIHQAAQRGDTLVIITLITNNTLVNQRTRDNDTPLHYAMKSLCIASIKVLLEHGANPLLINKNREMPIDWAINNGADESFLDILHEINHAQLQISISQALDIG